MQSDYDELSSYVREWSDQETAATEPSPSTYDTEQAEIKST